MAVKPHIKAEMLQTYQDLYFTINLMLSTIDAEKLRNKFFK